MSTQSEISPFVREASTSRHEAVMEMHRELTELTARILGEKQ